MSASQKPDLPQVSPWDTAEILEYLEEQYDLQTDEDCREEFGVTLSGLVSAAQELEPGETDIERQEDLKEMIDAFQEDYTSRHQVIEEDAAHRDEYSGKVRYVSRVDDPDNRDAWMIVDETEYVE